MAVTITTTETQEDANRAAEMFGEKVQADAPRTAPEAEEAGGEESVESAGGAQPREEPAAGGRAAEVEPEARERPANKRISRLTAEKRELEERVGDANARLADALAQLEEVSAHPAKGTNGKPTPESFPSYEDFIEAMTDWKMDQGARQRAAAEAQASQKALSDAVEANYKVRVDEAKGRYEDWDQAVGGSILQIPTVVSDAIKHARNGPDIVYHLAHHPEDAEAFAFMTPHQAVMAVGEMAAALASPARRIATTRAPAPVRGVAARAQGAPVKMDDLDYQDFKRLWDEQHRNR